MYQVHVPSSVPRKKEKHPVQTTEVLVRGAEILVRVATRDGVLQGGGIALGQSRTPSRLSPVLPSASPLSPQHSFFEAQCNF